MPSKNEAGGSLIEVMTAMVILAFSILGVTAMFQVADGGVRMGDRGTKALALAQARIEAKRTSPWAKLLADDLDLDGIPDVFMGDDGLRGDAHPGDGTYTGQMEANGIVVEWTVTPIGADRLPAAIAVMIESRAQYEAGGATKRLSLSTFRANPAYVGIH